MRIIEHVETQNAMGGTVQVGLIMPENVDALKLFNALWLTVYQFERSASRFIAASELTQLNTHTATKQPVSPMFREVLKAATLCAEHTQGLYNPFVLPAVQRTGYVRSSVQPGAKITHDARTLRITSATNLEIGTDWARIPYGTALDLGGCGKGFIVDKLAGIARKQGATGGWIEASGDLYAWGLDANGENLRIAIQDQHASTHTSYMVIVPPEGCGIATSGTFTRPGAGVRAGSHHIINPRTGKPAATDLSLATVVAPTALEADVLASCAIITGSKVAPAYLRDHKASSWLLQYDKRVVSKEPIVHGTEIVQEVAEVHHA